RRYVLAFFRRLQPCFVGIEACASSHHWSRELQAVGHTVRLMPPAYVKPYVKRQKNDAADAEAICEAVTRANIRFVPTKSPEQWPDATPHPPSVHSPADRSDQRDPRPSCRVWHCCAGRTQRRRTNSLMSSPIRMRSGIPICARLHCGAWCSVEDPQGAHSRVRSFDHWLGTARARRAGDWMTFLVWGRRWRPRWWPVSPIRRPSDRAG